jgi:uncharacterized protein (DUF486 family)
VPLDPVAARSGAAPPRPVANTTTAATMGASRRGLSTMATYLTPILLLIGSNVFMTFAWYGHLKFTDRPLWIVVIVSWGIAFFEYCLQVPANRYGYAVYNPAQLKAIQEIVTLCVFVAFSVLYLGAPIKWNHLAGFALIVVAAFLIFRD